MEFCNKISLIQSIEYFVQFSFGKLTFEIKTKRSKYKYKKLNKILINNVKKILQNIATYFVALLYRKKHLLMLRANIRKERIMQKRSEAPSAQIKYKLIRTLLRIWNN
ncbi:hypothetical protein BpHYR1_028571 [Brachionus plicatilis]|uniref:Uncharacterized protein n=1 Tax=Brachionus plicatilis TaxID=10195 RepID=A0A3M7QSP8_BRAPC|nr:hypothetical protein BpHYR1_028571 [Brachionus plicatilis]